MTRCVSAVGLALAAAVAGCGSLVGADCRAGLTRCGRLCVDLSSDPMSCGACGNACTAGRACVAGTCAMPLDSGPPLDGGRDPGRDTGIDGAGHDAATDVGTVDTGASDAGAIDGGAGDADAGAGDAAVDGGPDAGPVCGLGELRCGASCVDPNDPAHCGDCTTTCTAMQVCSAGTCTSACAPLTDCGTFCADLASDPDHCGTCTNSCGTGICVSGSCEAALAGHLVVIGHDFETRRIPMSQILANAVLLPGRANVRVLVWEGMATAAAVTGTYAGLMEGAGSRTYRTQRATTPESVPVLLDTSDTFLVLGQKPAMDAQLAALGSAWSTALDQFLRRGGVLVMLDAPSSTNRGTWQILEAAGLFHATSLGEMIRPRLSTALGRAGDPVLLGVPLSYRGESHTVFYVTSDPDGIVESPSGPVVLDRTVTP